MCSQSDHVSSEAFSYLMQVLGWGFIRGSREENISFDNFKGLQVHIYILNRYFYLRWADQTKFRSLQQMIFHKKTLFQKKKKNLPHPYELK